MIREKDWKIGTEWQVCATADFYKDYHKLPDGIAEWLTNYDGVGRYWYDGLFKQVYFERDEDRMVFVMKFG